MIQIFIYLLLQRILLQTQKIWAILPDSSIIGQLIKFTVGQHYIAKYAHTCTHTYTHSCNPNCYTEVWLVNNQKRVGVFAKQDIEEGIELTYDYHFQYVQVIYTYIYIYLFITHRIEPGASNPCYCNSSNCNGFIGKER